MRVGRLRRFDPTGSAEGVEVFARVRSQLRLILHGPASRRRSRQWIMQAVEASDLHERPSDGLINVWFTFVPREGWLPYDTEGLWATQLSDDTARVENVAFLQDGIAQGDVVRFQTNQDGVRWATGRVQASGHCVIRVLPVPSGALGPSASAVHGAFERFGSGGEVFSAELPLVAFDVPADADFAEIKQVLGDGESNGWWHYEVGCGTDRWWNSTGS